MTNLGAFHTKEAVANAVSKALASAGVKRPFTLSIRAGDGTMYLLDAHGELQRVPPGQTPANVPMPLRILATDSQGHELVINITRG